MKIINFRYLDVSFSFLVVVGIAYYSVNQTVVPSTEDPIAWESFDEGVTLAQQSDKKILVDVYTNWCTYCKNMDAEVYTNPKVPSLVNKHFVAINLTRNQINVLRLREIVSVKLNSHVSWGRTPIP